MMHSHFSILAYLLESMQVFNPFCYLRTALLSAIPVTAGMPLATGLWAAFDPLSLPLNPTTQLALLREDTHLDHRVPAWKPGCCRRPCQNPPEVQADITQAMSSATHFATESE